MKTRVTFTDDELSSIEDAISFYKAACQTMDPAYDIEHDGGGPAYEREQIKTVSKKIELARLRLEAGYS
jgi:hypothetical protein